MDTVDDEVHSDDEDSDEEYRALVKGTKLFNYIYTRDYIMIQIHDYFDCGLSSGRALVDASKSTAVMIDFLMGYDFFNHII